MRANMNPTGRAHRFTRVSRPQDLAVAGAAYSGMSLSGFLISVASARRAQHYYVLAIEYGPPPTAGEGIGIGRLLRRFSGPPNAIDHLVCSPDGHWLARGFGGKKGMGLFEAASGHETGQEGAYGDASYSAAFSRNRQIRLYAVESGALRKLAQAAAPGGKRPFPARFALDGRHVEMGLDDTTAAKV